MIRSPCSLIALYLSLPSGPYETHSLAAPRPKILAQSPEVGVGPVAAGAASELVLASGSVGRPAPPAGETPAGASASGGAGLVGAPCEHAKAEATSRRPASAGRIASDSAGAAGDCQEIVPH